MLFLEALPSTSIPAHLAGEPEPLASWETVWGQLESPGLQDSRNGVLEGGHVPLLPNSARKAAELEDMRYWHSIFLSGVTIRMSSTQGHTL